MPQSRITVSVKTTRILEPLDEEGHVDYLAALNQMASERVTPDNNAAVSFVRAFGVSGFKPAERTRFFKLLQIEPLRERGEYLTAFSDFVNRKLTRPPTKKELADFDRAMRAPWLGSEFPLVAEWLMSNQKPLDLVIAGSGRPKCYIPLVEPAHSGLDALLLPTVNASITAARALVIRAMLHLGETKISEAEQDLLACHRLGRLIGKVPFVIAAITGVGINNFACMADARLMESGRLSLEGAAAYERELNKLPPLPNIADDIDRSERFSFLDRVSLLARGRAVPIEDVPEAENSKRALDVIKWMIEHAAAINWDEVLRFGNEQFDGFVVAARKPNFLEAKKAFDLRNQEIRAIRWEIKDPEKLSGAVLGRSPLAKIRLARIIASLLMPSLSQGYERQVIGYTREALGQLGFALSAYRAGNVAYPESLNVLVPRYITRVPNDLFAEQSLKYKRQDDGFLLYSVGPNGLDDRGLTFDSHPPGDDIVLRIAHAGGTKK